MNDENRYEPYQYGVPQEPKFEEPDIVEQDVKAGEDIFAEDASEETRTDAGVEEPQFAEPDFDNSFYEDKKEQENSGYAPRYDYNYHVPQGSPKPENPKKGGNGCLKVVFIVFIAIVFGVVASIVFQGSNRIIDYYFGKTEGTTNNHSDKKVDSTHVVKGEGDVVQSDVADVVESVMPSVVSITNMSIQEVQNFWFGGTTQYESVSSGSGIVIGQNDSELLIVTNNHVVEGSQTLTVSFIDGESTEAQIKGTDSDMDLAIIAIQLSNMKSDTLDAIKVATMGDSDAIRVGEPTIAIGNALGYGQSVTTGIVSAVNRTLEDFEGELIQTDAAINPGNSGGALLNANGEVIGINTVKVSADAVEGMGYAIPISDVTDILNDLMNKETRTKVPENQRGTIGIMGRSVDAQTAEYYNMPEGVYVSELVEGGGAEKAGLPVHCIITEINGTDVDSMEELQEQLQYYKAGEKVELTIEVQSDKGYVEKNIEVALGKAQ